MQSIALSDGRRVTLGRYVRAIRTAKAHPNATFPDSQCGLWPATGREIVGHWWQAVVERINRNLSIPSDRKGPAARLARRHQKHGRECKWCGSHFTPRTAYDCFCDPSCARSYHC